MQTARYVEIGLWLANVVVYGCGLWLWARPEGTQARSECPLCGTHSDPLCVPARIASKDDERATTSA